MPDFDRRLTEELKLHRESLTWDRAVEFEVGPACRAHDYPQLFTKLCKICGTVRERSHASRVVAIRLRACCIVARAVL